MSEKYVASSVRVTKYNLIRIEQPFYVLESERNSKGGYFAKDECFDDFCDAKKEVIKSLHIMLNKANREASFCNNLINELNDSASYEEYIKLVQCRNQRK